MGKRALSMSDFDYELPRELIAQTPIEPRDASRLLVIERAAATMEHRHFRDIGDYLRPGDLLVANQSRVIPARLFGRKAQTGGAVEILLLAERTDLGINYWEALVRPGRSIREGMRILFADETGTPRLEAEIQGRTEAGGRIIHFSPLAVLTSDHDKSSLDVPEQLLAVQMTNATLVAGCAQVISKEWLAVHAAIEQLGKMPLPPYIHETLNDPERYQTVYARISGSAAAPTAGLHFTPHLLDQLRAQGVNVAFVTLHVGLDTFRPVEVENFSEHKMHSEVIHLDATTAEQIRKTRARGGRIVAVGTTSVRVLESVASIYDGEVEAYEGRTELFITPGYRYQVVDAMITNFHLPRSTLLLLVSAFMGKELMERAYQEAIRERYRFFSFGDAMLIL